MIRENVLEYFKNSKKESFRWLTGSIFSQHLSDFSLTFRTVDLGKLHLPTGKIVASDPTVYFDEKPFVIQVETGSYSVILSIARIAENNNVEFQNERVAFAMLKFREKLPIRWEIAVRENDDISKSNRDSFFGYGVDSGTGCFMDVETQSILNDLYFDSFDTENNIDSVLCKLQEKNFVPVWDWINYDFECLPNNNLIAFSSGLGDGEYASYFGFDENNQAVCLVTDFGIVKDSYQENL